MIYLGVSFLIVVSMFETFCFKFIWNNVHNKILDIDQILIILIKVKTKPNCKFCGFFFQFSLSFCLYILRMKKNKSKTVALNLLFTVVVKVFVGEWNWVFLWFLFLWWWDGWMDSLIGLMLFFIIIIGCSLIPYWTKSLAKKTWKFNVLLLAYLSWIWF